MRFLHAGLTRSTNCQLLLLLCTIVLFGQFCARPSAANSLTVSPAYGSTVADDRPVISVDFASPTAVKYESARLWLDGREVTGNCLRTPQFISYQALFPMKSGQVTVRFTGLAADSTPIERKWSFSIKPAPGITSIAHDAGEQSLGEYDDLTVTMKGLPGGKARFEIGEYRFSTPMSEVKPGVYVGTYRVQPGDHCQSASIIGYLGIGTKEYAHTCERPVTMWANLFRVIVETPKDSAEVSKTFLIKGRTRPNSNVSIIPQLGFSDKLAAPSAVNNKSPMGSVPCLADEHGNFSVEYGCPIILPNLHVVFTVVASDEKGNRSVPVSIWCKFK